MKELKDLMTHNFGVFIIDCIIAGLASIGFMYVLYLISIEV